MKVSIIISHYNYEGLKDCLKSVLAYTDLSDKEIIISCNGSSEETREWLKTLPVKVIWSDKPTSFAIANNAGIREAYGEYVVLLNDDTILLPQKKDDWINTLINPFLKYPFVGVTGPKILQWEANDFIVFFCVMIKRSIFGHIGMLDEKFEIGGGEDIQFCINLRKRGFDLVQVGFPNNFPIYHKGEETVGKNPNWQKIFDKNLSKIQKI